MWVVREWKRIVPSCVGNMEGGGGACDRTGAGGYADYVEKHVEDVFANRFLTISQAHSL